MMNVILLQKVENLGELGDQVMVKPGYGRNYLIPQGKAAPATAANIAEYEARRADLERAAQAARAEAEARKARLEALGEITMTTKVGAEDKLYGSIGTADIAAAVTAAGVEVERGEVRLPEDGPLRSVGEHQIELHLHSDMNVALKVIVDGEQ
jgi:large subunit ribosomal protein L9